VLEPRDGERHPEVLVSDAERQQLIDTLRLHTAEGRLTLDEFSERVGYALAARTTGDLVPLTADLPVGAAPVPETRRRRVVKWTVAVMSGSTRRGRWRVGEQTNAVSFMGGCFLDLRKAEFSGPEIEITAVAFMGHVDIVVPEGVEVDLGGIAFMGGKEAKIKAVPILPGSPIVRVRAFAFMGGVTVRSRPIKDDTAESGQGDALSSGSRSRRRNPPGLPNLPNRPDRPERGRDRDRDRDRHRGHDHGHLGWDDDPVVERAPRDVEVGPAELASIADTTPEGTVTILFSDINERLGDGPARDILLEHNRIVRSHVERCGGHEVKFQGDGFMVAFAGAGKALGCAIDLQQALDEWSSSDAAEPLRVRIGLHTGEVVREDQDFLGRTVNVASRIADQAKGGEVLVSSLLKELATGTGYRFGEPREAVLKGLTGTFTLYPVVWR
jgi:class 3 adenylate cyclase